MADVHTPEQRSFNMSRIRGKDTKPEMIVRQFLHKNGFRYRIHVKDLPGKPDIVMPKYRTVIFIHGCFWHGHEGCRYFIIPKTRTEWWTNKIMTSRRKDQENTQSLRNAGWNVVTIFECELRPLLREKSLKNLLLYLRAPSADSLDFNDHE
ncbi:very short patch repair endonuclease [Nibrella saemangeumensis]|uniref:Very short patch repair endonuclease n=1 Tax=Nibrella saemangeumensis TaxID=1084526 RepID=A0ABP8MGG8_9BACT